MSDTDRHPYVVLLDRIIAAAEAGDATDLYDVYADGAVIWHNHDNREQTVERNAKVLEAMPRFVSDRTYTDRQIQVFDGGVVQQHVLRGVNRESGEKVALHACVVVRVNDEGRITRLDEYIDSAEAAGFGPAPQRSA
ncbi:nuclear transport factor 2 family protein [Mumia zhuanghuii]|uniref:Nuclear transport factor 2 family protein n=2 Tax=Mumia TaxID=1546255 RepID=A0ABW1QKD9_9ACTN|nr:MULTISPECIES: nuclear transport factor 2 family protein [Mumia]KAA1422983.1 nuclear transport factor 2 family protein [Mumia zhuanghuii]